MRSRLFGTTATCAAALFSCALAAAAGVARTDPLVNPSMLTHTKIVSAVRLSSMTHNSLASLTAMGEAGGKVFGAGQGMVAIIGDSGVVASSKISVPLQRPSGLSAFTRGKLIVGDAADNAVYAVQVETKRSQKLFSLSELDARGVRGAMILRSGRLGGLAFDGKFIYAGVAAGYSSSIFKIDPSTRKVVGHTWAPGPNPTAMQFYKGSLFVLEADRKNIRRFDGALQLSEARSDIAVSDGRGLIMRDDGVRILSPSRKTIERLQIDTSKLVRSAPIHGTISTTVASAIVSALTPQKYALLICGDVAESGFDEFWNDTVWMYKVLKAKGYTKEHIYVLYGNGSDYASANPTYQVPGETVTDFAATLGYVNLVLDGLKNGDSAHGIAKMKSTDTLFVWTFDHGGGGPTASTLCLVGTDISDTDFAAKLNAVPCEKRAIFMQQCRSGGFIDNLANDKTFISTACRGGENAHPADTEKETVGGTTYHHGEYNYYIISALGGATPTGAAVNADTNGNGKCSAFEAHQWMVGHENRSEVPQVSGGSVGTGFHLN